MFVVKPTVLIVGDQPPAGMLIERFIRSIGVRTVVVTSTDEALAYMAKKPVALVLTDFVLPAAAAALADAMHARESLAQIAIVMLSEVDSLEARIGAAEAGARAFLPKPFTRAELTDTLFRILSEVSPPMPPSTGVSLEVPVETFELAIAAVA